MLESLRLKNIGPAPEMELELASRLNLLTGDNGLGKSFLLDVAWWALTRKWPKDLNGNLTSGYQATPIDMTRDATIEFRLATTAGSLESEGKYEPRRQAWITDDARPSAQDLVVYALGDGGFAVWDPARNYWISPYLEAGPKRTPGYVFTNQDVWNGLIVSVDGKPTQVCNGLIADWASWIRERGDDSRRMADVLRGLTALPTRSDGIEAGSGFARLSLNDARDIPTIRMGYGQDVPIVHAALGVRRIVALAYMLSWAWREHKIAARQLGEAPTDQLVILFDEVEAHLHPRWQRMIVPALLKVGETLNAGHTASMQVLAATHSPLVLASVEPLFDIERDRLFTLELVDGEVTTSASCASAASGTGCSRRAS
jgi:hypothetical protein